MRLISGKCLVEAENSDLVCVDNDSVNTDNEDQSCMSVSTKKCKQSKKGDREGKEVKKEEKQKTKKNKMILKGFCWYFDITKVTLKTLWHQNEFSGF